MHLVEVKKNEVYCDSSIVARKLGQTHKFVVKKIIKLKDDLEKQNLGGLINPPKLVQEDRIYRGQGYTAYLMNREFFSLLVPKIRTKKALEWHLRFNEQFFEMEKRLLQVENNASDKYWIGTRNQGKLVRKGETDIIKDFVEYATEQGSKHSKYYYKHITNATYKALGLMSQKKPKLRDAMNIFEISQLILAERHAQLSIKKYMDLGRNYKDIYQSAKEDLIKFSNSLRIAE